MPLVTLKMTEEEVALIETLVAETYSRSRSEYIRDALMYYAENRFGLTPEVSDAKHARRYYLSRARRK